MKETKDTTLALERLAELMVVKVSKVGPRKYLLHVDDGYPLSAKRCLAKLVRLAQYSEEHGGHGMSKDDVRDVIRLIGPLNTTGLSGPEADEINMVLTR